MGAQTNPRTVYPTGGAIVVSLPRDFREATGIDEGDQVVLEETDNGFKATKVEFQVVDDGV